MTRLALFRFDASAAVGGGHAVRCLALAEALARRGWAVRFACNDEAFAVVPALAARRDDCLVVVAGAAAEAAQMAARYADGCALLAVDHYDRDRGFESACRGFARRLLAIDDLADRRHDCDILVDQNRSDEAAYRDLTPARCRQLLGPRYALLRPEFPQWRPAALARRKSRAVQRVLISCGFTDPANLTGKALAAVAAKSLAVDIALGPGAPHLAEVEAEVARRGGMTRLHVGGEGMAELMRDADIAIGAAGVSSWERCCLGLPTIAALAADNQQVVAAALERAGAAIVLGPAAKLSVEIIGAAVNALCHDHARRWAISAAAAGLCDGAGAERVAAAADEVVGALAN